MKYKRFFNVTNKKKVSPELFDITCSASESSPLEKQPLISEKEFQTD